MHDRLIWMALGAALLPAAALALAAPPANTAPAPAKPAGKPGATVGEVVVTGEKPAVQTSIDRRSYSLSNDLQAQSGSVADALRSVPSVEVDVQGNVSLRGDPNVTILIDGKPSGQFSGDNKGQALQQLPADRIERVEVITNPSAEFRADGSAGIINLVTKKAKGVGQTGSVRVMAGNADRFVVSSSTGYNSKDLSLSGDLNYRHETQKQESLEERGRLDPATGAFDSIVTDQVLHLRFDAYNARGSADYDLDDKTRLSGEIRGAVTDFALGALSHTERQDSRGALTTVFDRGLDIDQERANGEVTAGLRRKFEGAGHELSVKASYEVTNDDRVRSGLTTPVFPLTAPVYDQQRIGNDLRQTDIRADYVRPMANSVTLKAGFDLQFDDNSYDNIGLRGPSRGALGPDPTLTNRFLYEQQLLQAYVTYERPFGGVTVQAGLRLEDARQDLTQVTLGQTDDNDYFHAYPSVHVAWKLSDTQQVTGSYSDRVQRPQPDELNAFRFLLDPITYRAGNPNLQPQETHSFELGYQFRKAPTFILATLYYRQNENVVTDVVRDLGGGVFLLTRENVSETRNGGLELVTNGRLTKTLTYNVSGNVFWNELDAASLGFPGKRSTVSLFGRANLNWQATPKDFLQLNAFMNGKRLAPQGYVAPSVGVNLGYRRKLTDQLSFQFTAQDILGTYREKIVTDTPVLKSKIRRDYDTRFFLAGFVYTFGGGKPRDSGFEFQNGAPPQ